jgi:uncharacterized protein (TIGR03435 family)
MVGGPGPAGESLTGQLTQMLGRTVIDKTGLTGSFTVQLKWVAETATAVDGASPGSSGSDTGLDGPSIFTAVQEQLGLKLQSAKGPVAMTVIDRVERPSEN